MVQGKVIYEALINTIYVFTLISETECFISPGGNWVL